MLSSTISTTRFVKKWLFQLPLLQERNLPPTAAQSHLPHPPHHPPLLKKPFESVPNSSRKTTCLTHGPTSLGCFNASKPPIHVSKSNHNHPFQLHLPYPTLRPQTIRKKNSICIFSLPPLTNPGMVNVTGSFSASLPPLP